MTARMATHWLESHRTTYHTPTVKGEVEMRNAERGGGHVKRILTLALMVFLVVSSTGSALAFDPGLILDPVVCDGSIPPEDTVVAWDVSMGAQIGDHTTLVGDLQGAGFTVGTVNINEAFITGQGIPPCIDMVVITSKANGTCLNVPFGYDQTVFDGILPAVQGGLRLFLLNDWMHDCGWKTAPIAHWLGASTPSGDTGPGSQPTFEAGSQYQSDNPSALFSGVASWRAYRASHYWGYDDGVVATMPDGTGDAAMIAKPLGEGCTVMVGDSDWIQNAYIDDPGVDNRALANNVFRYLEHCGPWANPNRLVRGRGNIDSPAATAGAPTPGEASYVLVAKHSKGAFVGSVSLVDETAKVVFESESSSASPNFWGWLTEGNKASFEGIGTLTSQDFPNGVVSNFKIWAGDGTADGGEDSFRISIPDASYDNCVGCEEPYNVAINKGRIAIQGKE
jgi:hypothetical protein